MCIFTESEWKVTEGLSQPYDGRRRSRKRKVRLVSTRRPHHVHRPPYCTCPCAGPAHVNDVGLLNVSAFVCVYTDLPITQVARVQSSRLQGFRAVKLPSTKVEPGTIMAHHTNILVATSGLECANAIVKEGCRLAWRHWQRERNCRFEVAVLLGMSALVVLNKPPSLFSRRSVRTRCRISRTIFRILVIGR